MNSQRVCVAVCELIFLLPPPRHHHLLQFHDGFTNFVAIDVVSSFKVTRPISLLRSTVSEEEEKKKKKKASIPENNSPMVVVLL